MIYTWVPFINWIDWFSILPTKIYLIYNGFCIFILFPVYKLLFQQRGEELQFNLNQ
jgi:hypothetical protein